MSFVTDVGSIRGEKIDGQGFVWGRVRVLVGSDFRDWGLMVAGQIQFQGGLSVSSEHWVSFSRRSII